MILSRGSAPALPSPRCDFVVILAGFGVPPLQVRFLEQQNKLLETKWGLLRAQPPPRSSLGALLEGYVGTLRRQLEGLGQERQRLRTELGHVRGLVEEFKAKSVSPKFPGCLHVSPDPSTAPQYHLVSPHGAAPSAALTCSFLEELKAVSVPECSPT